MVIVLTPSLLHPLRLHQSLSSSHRCAHSMHLSGAGAVTLLLLALAGGSLTMGPSGRARVELARARSAAKMLEKCILSSVGSV